MKDKKMNIAGANEFRESSIDVNFERDWTASSGIVSTDTSRKAHSSPLDSAAPILRNEESETVKTLNE
jgi:hypothetical protein